MLPASHGRAMHDDHRSTDDWAKRPVHHLRALRATSERGFVLPSAIIMLFILTLLTAAAITVATQTSTSTTRDDNVKAEVEAAEAGLHTADYRLGQLKPSETQCIGEAAAVEAKTTAEAESKCKDSTESLGNGATFRYWTTLPIASGTCAGRTVEKIEGVVQRCVTAEGKVNGVEPAVRLQTRVVGSGGESLFSIAGILGLTKVLINGSVSVPGVVASNGEIRGEGSANFQNGFEICPPPKWEGKFKPGTFEERKSSGVKVHGTNPELVPAYEKTRAETACPIKAPLPSVHPTPESNEDSRIGVQDKFELAGYTWNKEKYELTLESVAKLTLGESGKTTKYFFCSFRMPGGGPELKIAAGAKVELYIGNAEEYPKTCAKESGTFEIAGGSKTENVSKNPAAFLVEIGGKGPFRFANGSGKTLEAAVYAPNATVKIEGGVEFKGGVVGKEVFLEGGSKFFEWSEELSKLTGGSAAVYGRKVWEQCGRGSGSSEGC
jgi:Tfp pilus assembly protein PilX